MARGEFVENSVWEELEPLSAPAAWLYVWSFTNPRCNMAGLYPVSERSMLESKVTVRQLPRALEELQGEAMMFYDRPLVWIKARVKRIHSKNANIAKAIAKDVGQVDADHWLRVAFLERYAEMPWLKGPLSGVALESRNARTLREPSRTIRRVPSAVHREKDSQPSTPHSPTRTASYENGRTIEPGATA